MDERRNYKAVYQNYLSRVKGKAGDVPRLTQSTIFLVQAINTTKSSYTFDPLEFAGQAADELRLNLNDEFTATDFGVYLKGTVTDAAAASTTSVLLTANQFELLAAGQSLKSGNLFAGAMSLDINNVKFIEKFDLRRNNMVRQGRFTEASNTNYDFNQDGMVALAPMVTLSGAKKNTVTLSLPEALAPFTFGFVGATQTMTYTIDSIALRFFGLNAQNAAKFQ